jgi:hypothetical protein
MSTTTRGPVTPVVRRTIPRGSVNRGESAGGVIQPFTHVSCFFPRVFGGFAGTAGGVGEGVTTLEAAAADGDGAREGVTTAAGCAPSQPASSVAATINEERRADLRISDVFRVSGPLEDTHRASVW